MGRKGLGLNEKLVILVTKVGEVCGTVSCIGKARRLWLCPLGVDNLVGVLALIKSKMVYIAW